MTYFFLFLNFAFMIALPLVLATYLARRYRQDWGLFGIGAATFIGAQLLHIPFNLLLGRWGLLSMDSGVVSELLLLAVILGLSAGVFEEVARYLSYRYWAINARSWAKGLMLGAGHGGIEAMLLGFIGLANFLFFLTVNVERLALLVPTESLPIIRAQITSMATVGWYDALLGALERVFALIAHLALSVMVLQAFLRGQRGWRHVRWLLLAIAYHTLLNTVAVFAAGQWNIYVAELGVGLVALLGLVIIRHLRDNPEEEAAMDILPAPEVSVSARPFRPVSHSPDQLDNSRFQDN
jgi:uncharacterized membrane protein YhfC